MQLVLSNNRILAHGENFLAMGGVVINTETGVKYENATIAECSGCPSDIDKVGYEYHAGRFVPCAPFGVGTGNVAVYCDDCKTPRDSGKSVDDFYGMSNYLAFVASQDSDTIDAAFGKNNEDIVRGVGAGLAMYSWFKGVDKTVHPFTNLRKMPTLNDMNIEVYKEIAENEIPFWFIISSTYATNKIFSEIQVSENFHPSTGGGSMVQTEKIVNFKLTDEDLTMPFGFIFSAKQLNDSGEKVNVYINDVFAKSYYDTDDGESKSEKGLEEWSKYNITSAGTYSIKMVLGAYPGGRIESSFSIYKSRNV